MKTENQNYAYLVLKGNYYAELTDFMRLLNEEVGDDQRMVRDKCEQIVQTNLTDEN